LNSFTAAHWLDGEQASINLRVVFLRQLSFRTTEDGATIFGNQAATVPPFSPNGTVSMIHLSVVQQGKPTHPSPSARQF
jgi:hypothetical protein